MPKKKFKLVKAEPKEKRLRVWIEPDNVANVRIETARNGRTIQGEVNCVLRDHYASAWDAVVSPPYSFPVNPTGMKITLK